MCIGQPVVVDRELLLCFFLEFARFEYALKASGMFVRHPEEPGRPPKAEPDWPTFARSLRGTFDAAANGRLAEACTFLRNSPPNRQVIVVGEVAWQTSSVAEGETDIEFLLRMVRVVRNNLFHGGKYNADPHESIERTELLLRSSLAVLEACLHIAPAQRAAYEDARL
jgi:hypothetical protein